MFKKGDLVTGVDRSFTRSIYRVWVVKDFSMGIKIVSFDGFVYKNVHRVDFIKYKEFRLATPYEIRVSAGISNAEDFISDILESRD